MYVCGWHKSALRPPHSARASRAANFFSKLVLQLPLTGYTSMGHCLGASDPSYPWELLVPLMAAVYHVSAWMVPAGLFLYSSFSAGLLRMVARVCERFGIQEIAFPVAWFLLYHLLAALLHGKLTNVLISEMVSSALFVVCVAILSRVLQRAARAHAEAT